MSPMTHGHIRIEDHQLSIEGVPFYSIPELTEEFLVLFLRSTPSDAVFVGDIIEGMRYPDRLKIRDAARTLGGDAWEAYKRAALSWRGVVNQDNKWHISDFDFVYKARIPGGGWAEAIAIADCGMKLIQTQAGYFTFPEFKRRYGKDIVSFLNSEMERVETGIKTIIEHISSEIIERTCLVSDKIGNLSHRNCRGLSVDPPSKWIPPEGFTIIDIAEG